MARGPRGESRPADTVSCAVAVARIATGEAEDDRYSAPGRKRSGQAGGKIRAERLTAEQRVEVAKKGAAIRWA